MTPRERSGRGAERRFLLERAPDEGEPRLAAGEAEHALRVLRLAAGDRLIGLDRRGGAWELRVRATSRTDLSLEAAGGEPRREPEPGAPGAPLPWLELWVSPPRAPRAEGLVERLCQLGAAALVWVTLERTPPHARGERGARLIRIADEALKQSGRLWPLELHGPLEIESALAARCPGALLALDPAAPLTLGEQLDGDARGSAGVAPLARPVVGTRTSPLVIVVGPEGGLAPAELERLAAAGASSARLAPHVLRIETAAEAAAAIVAHRALGALGARSAPRA